MQDNNEEPDWEDQDLFGPKNQGRAALIAGLIIAAWFLGQKLWFYLFP